MTLAEALQRKVIDDSSVLQDPLTHELITVREAITKGILDVTAGKIVDHKSKEARPLISGIRPSELEKSPSRIMPLLSLHQALKQGLYDSEFNSVANPVTGERLSLEDAIERGVIDPRSRIIDPFRERTVTLEDAVESGMLDPNIGLVISTKVGESMSLEEAFQQDLIVPTDDDLETFTLRESIDRGIISQETGLFEDPNTLQDISIPSAVSLGVLNLENVCVLDQDSNRFVSLPEAVKLGLYHPKTCDVYDRESSGLLTVVEAWKRGLMIEEKGLSWQDILEQGLFNQKDGTITHPQSGESLSLQDALTSKLIDANNTLVQVPVQSQSLLV